MRSVDSDISNVISNVESDDIGGISNKFHDFGVV